MCSRGRLVNNQNVCDSLPPCDILSIKTFQKITLDNARGVKKTNNFFASAINNKVGNKQDEKIDVVNGVGME